MKQSPKRWWMGSIQYVGFNCRINSTVVVVPWSAAGRERRSKKLGKNPALEILLFHSDKLVYGQQKFREIVAVVGGCCCVVWSYERKQDTCLVIILLRQQDAWFVSRWTKLLNQCKLDIVFVDNVRNLNWTLLWVIYICILILREQ